MDNISKKRGKDKMGEKQEVGSSVLQTSGRKHSVEEQEVWGGSVSMETSQLGNHCKSKHEGDIKGLNDKEREGRERDCR